MTPLNKLSKKEKLKGHKLIDFLFKERKSIKAYPFVIIYKKIEYTGVPILLGVSASKRNFKKAVDRNKIKRLTREAFRTQKQNFGFNAESSDFTLATMFIYIGSDIPSYDQVSKGLQKAFRRLQSIDIKH